jgi:hypothetical protein
MPYDGNIGGMRGGTGDAYADLQIADLLIDEATKGFETAQQGIQAVAGSADEAKEMALAANSGLDKSMHAIARASTNGIPKPGFSETVQSESAGTAGTLAEQVGHVATVSFGFQLVSSGLKDAAWGVTYSAEYIEKALTVNRQTIDGVALDAVTALYSGDARDMEQLAARSLDADPENQRAGQGGSNRYAAVQAFVERANRVLKLYILGLDGEGRPRTEVDVATMFRAVYDAKEEQEGLHAGLEEFSSDLDDTAAFVASALEMTHLFKRDVLETMSVVDTYRRGL